MCEYCSNAFGHNKLLKHNVSDSEIEIDPKDSTINIDYTGWDEYYYDDIEINYCPMCGRRLNLK